MDLGSDEDAALPRSDEFEAGAEPSEIKASDLASEIDTQDFSEVPPLDSLHIDEVEPPPPNEPAVPNSPLVPMLDTPSTGIRGSRASKASKTFRNMGNRVPTESMRARAEEVNSGSKFVPKIEEKMGDFFGIETELAAWFESCFSGPQLDNWITDLKTEYRDGRHKMSSVRKLLHECLIHESATRTSSAVDQLTKKVNDSHWLELVDLPSEDEDVHTLLFLGLSAWKASGKAPLQDKGVDLLAELLAQIATMRWYAELDDEERSSAKLLSRLFMLTRSALLAVLGDAEDLKKAQHALWLAYGLKPPSLDGEEDYTSPVNYAEFMEEISKRYPGLMAHLHSADNNHEYTEHARGKHLKAAHLFGDSNGHNNDTSTGTGSVSGSKSRFDRQNSGSSGSSSLNDRSGNGSNSSSLDNNSIDNGQDPADPRDLVNDHNTVMPYVPKSIVEASELYKSKVRPCPASLQLYEVQDNRDSLPNWDRVKTKAEPARTINYLYTRVSRLQKSVVRVVVDFVMQAGASGPGPQVHAALSTIWYLLQWLQTGHTLMFEHLGALLFDCQFHLVAHLFCSGNPRVASHALEPYTGGERFWQLVTSTKAEYDGPPLNWSVKDTAQLTIRHFNRFNLQTYTHLIGICRLMVTGKTQRLLVVAELPVDPFKPLFGLYESETWLQLLLYMKAQVPFTGKRWRHMNMELISAIYLYCPARIDDNWLSGNDVTQVVRNAPAEERTLRELIEHFSSLNESK